MSSLKHKHSFLTGLLFIAMTAVGCGGNDNPGTAKDGGSTDGQVANLCANSASRCDDKVACTRDSCDEATGECRHQADHALCSAGTVCMPKEGCKSPPPCATDADCPDTDNSPCMQEYCEPASSTCRWNPLDKDGDGHAPQICADIGGDDCDDNDYSRHPGVEEECNGRDDNCDGKIDNIKPSADGGEPAGKPDGGSTDGQLFYRDADGDGFGNPAVSQEACSAPEGYVSNADDCDDTDLNISPNATEVCDGKDNNCDGDTDEPQTFYQDQDSDGYGNPEVRQEACSAPEGYVENARDCNDTDANITTDGCWTDSSSGLTWQNPPPENGGEWQEAIDCCENLTLDGYSDWRLPTISELRSLIRGCPGTESGESCGVTDDCLCPPASCLGNGCNGCNDEDGPANGCYWPNEMEGSCWMYWSSSACVDSVYGDVRWGVNFYNGYVESIGWYVRCVRGGP